MVDVLDFNDAIADSKAFGTRHLLLGNGFSIACSETFKYPSLLAAADFSSDSRLPEVFKTLGTEDFEKAIRRLQDASRILPIYKNVISGADKMVDEMAGNAEALKSILVSTIANTHPRSNSNFIDFEACRNFLSHFLGRDNEEGNVYTLNYDLLLYWARVNKYPYLGNDGFGHDKDRNIIWGSENPQTVHYLHGALHLFYTRLGLQKHTWEWNSPLQKRVQDAISAGNFPLFVAEGESTQKLYKIERNAYLRHCHQNFVEKMGQGEGALFIFGHSLSESDSHILNCIVEGKIPMVYVSLRGDVNSTKNREIKALAQGWETRRSNGYPLKVKFFQSESAEVWGQQISAHTELDDGVPF